MATQDYNKAFGAGGATLFAGAIATIIVHIVKAKWPNFVDPDIIDAIRVVIIGGFAFLGAYLMPHFDQSPPPTK